MMSEPDWDNLPAIAITQWRAGRVLSEDDVKLIGRLLKEHDDDMAAEVDTFHNGRQQAIYEIGGQELVDLMEKADEAFTQIALKKAFAHYAAKCAERDAMNN